MRPWNARSSVVPFRSPSSTTRLFGSAVIALASASAPKSRDTVQKPSLGVTRTDPRCATYTASGPRAVATVVRSARTSSAASAFDSAGLVLASCPTSPRTTFTGRVSDSAILTPHQVSTLTEPFQRGTERLHTAHAGVGLGLAIVKTITGAHDGTLTLTPRPAGGLRVTVELPANQPHPPCR